MASEIASTTVVMNGEAMTAGSKPIFLASSGSVQPTSLAANTVTISVRQMTAATVIVMGLPKIILSTSSSLTKFAALSTAAQSTATRISFQMTRRRSENSISSSEMPRMTVTLACEPQFPPVSINMGI